MRRTAAATVLALLLAAPLARTLGAQGVPPNAHWRTLRTTHFRVHFTPELEEPARRAAADAEAAYAALATQLKPPRGTVDLVVADNVDFTNGAATPVPSNRIVIYAQPPVASPSLRYYDDWTALVITHELTHIFHLDRAGGWWGAAQRLFGRAPWLFPNEYAPAWVTEGLAVYYESALTGAGRVRGSFEPMIVRAALRENALPGLGDLSLVSSRYPGGEMAYGYGALFLDFLARTRGPASIADFVRRSSRAPLPFTLDFVARRSFGRSFGAAWREWRDSLRLDSLALGGPLAGWRDLTHEGFLAVSPRWADGATLLYGAATGRDVPGLYRVRLAGAPERLARRTDVGANVPTARGVLYADLEFTDPYHLRSDLYLDRGGRRVRLTRGARLSEPDARADGAIVAVRALPATTQLVRVSADGRSITALTAASLDTQWASPRWSPNGDRIAAARWTRGGYADVVVLDSAGRVLHALTHDRAVDAEPAWTPDGAHVVFTSDRAGATDVYVAAADGSDSVPRRLSHAVTGLFYPDVSPDGRSLAAARFAADGWHVGVAPLDTAAADAPALLPAFDAPALGAAAHDSSRARPYGAWRSLLPRYWLPEVADVASGRTGFGASTSGSDVVARHAFAADVLLDPHDGEHEWDAAYEYAGLGVPVLDLGASQEWTRFGIVDTADAPVGALRRRARFIDAGVTFERPRVRTSAFLRLAGELEWRQYSTDPAPLLGELDPIFASGPRYRSLLASAGWANARRPALAVSAEDGVSLGATGRLRWIAGESAPRSRSVTAAANAYRGLDLPGFAHHVLAARGAVGLADGTVPDVFDVGGTSATPVSLVPGVSVGERRTFAVRGFSAGSLVGRRALAGTLEYRAPLARPSRGRGLVPVFLDRVSVAAFADAGTAWDPDPRRWIASAGAELVLDAALQYDQPYRIRAGVAVPTVNRALVGASAVTAYVRVGSAF